MNSTNEAHPAGQVGKYFRRKRHQHDGATEKHPRAETMGADYGSHCARHGTLCRDIALANGKSFPRLAAVTARAIKDPSYLLIGCQIVSVIWALPVALVAVLLFVVADTWPGRGFALAALLLAILPAAAISGWATQARRRIRGSAGMAAAVVVLVGLLWINAPTRDPMESGRVMSQFTGQAGGWLRQFPFSLVPEGDQLLLGFTLMTVIDPLLTATQAAELRRVTSLLYREQAADPDFAKLGSAMPEAYAELLGFASHTGHSYVYVPPGIDLGKPAPVLVFFHGAGGNFQAYLWILSSAADRLGFVLVAPTHGMGFWREEASAAAVESALTAAGRVTSIDAGRIHLAGLSNGGLAVSQLAGAQGNRFTSLIFLSPVFAPGQIGSAGFALRNRARPVLVITGARDDRVPLHYVEDNIDAMRKGGAKVELVTMADADHFLMFTHRTQLVDALVSWFSRPVSTP
jgi:pimeloyl-ACP methyl ester carboxylesterase